MKKTLWTYPAPTGHPSDALNDLVRKILRNPLCAAAPTADEWRDLAKLLRTLARFIFQGGRDLPFVSEAAERIRYPIVAGWYRPLYPSQQDPEQLRLFAAVNALLADIASGTADSPCERLGSLATDVDELAASIDPRPVAANTTEPPSRKLDGCYAPNEVWFRGAKEFAAPLPWRLLNFMWDKIDPQQESEVAVNVWANQNTTTSMIKNETLRANTVLEKLRSPRRLSRGDGFLSWV